ncbi:HET-domain-containing protein [Parathielavia appendiculata]|uniref:HET-domain-containing protein n=1 Tax=Parathielavia appendiculata TaxID=2587402 RepID=A0AAN6TS09_9PEZI|nr:HET-domain-containing protein [Parathielavia appendiculata]
MEEETSHRYLYSRIEPDEFRVLRILEVYPEIRFRMKTFSIHDAPEYQALSYAWGTSTEEEECICNDARYRISRTLGQALRGLYRHANSSWIWVDAICINQADDVEKADQVAGMGELYAYADRVLVWLGEAADDSDLACVLLPELTDSIWTLRDCEGKWNPIKLDDLESHRLPVASDPLWRAAFLLYARPWFQRLWIVQEIVLARDALFLCGKQKLEWHVVANFAVATMRSEFVGNLAVFHVRDIGTDQVTRSTNGIKLIHNLMRLQEGLEDPGKEVGGLYGAMQVMLSQAASVKVDYVYAVLGMLSEAIREKVVVDYSDEVKQNYGLVHASFFRLCLERVKDWPSILFSPTTARSNAPSWCPAWGSGWNAGYLPVVACRAGRPITTSFLPSFNSPPHATGGGGEETLRITGLCVDTVGDVFPFKQVIDEVTGYMTARRVLNFINDCAAYVPDGADNHRRFLGILIGEYTWFKNPVFFDLPDNDVLDSLLAFLEPLAEKQEHEAALDTDKPALDPDEQHRFWQGRYLNLLLLRWPGRSFGLTTSGRMMILPCDAKPGDTIGVFLGATLPQVLARHEDGLSWRYIGPAVVDGIMKGEIFKTMEDWLSRQESFSLR